MKGDEETDSDSETERESEIDRPKERQLNSFNGSPIRKTLSVFTCTHIDWLNDSI
jgi:hypothetical protein